MWFIIGIFIGIISIGFVWWLKRKNVTLRWHEWLIGGVGFLLLLYTVQNTFGFLTEIEPTAAALTAAFLGIPALVLLGMAWQLVVRRRKLPA
jgi:hypothetical protein